MKIICPFCNNVLDSKDDVPSIATRTFGNDYVCHKVICRNVDKHPDHNTIAVIFTPEKNDENK